MRKLGVLLVACGLLACKKPTREDPAAKKPASAQDDDDTDTPAKKKKKAAAVKDDDEDVDAPKKKSKPAAKPGDGAKDAVEEENLVGIASGAMIISDTAPDPHKTWLLLDGDRRNYWQTPPGTYTAVIALAQPSLIERIQFQGATKHLKVEASNDATSGYETIADAELDPKQVKLNQSFGDGALQKVDVEKKAKAKYLRFTFTNDKDVEWTQSNELRVFGKKLEEPSFTRNLTGTWDMGGEGYLHIKQDGKALVGCFAPFEFNATVEGPWVRGSWHQPGQDLKGPVGLNISPDEKQIAWFRSLPGGGATSTMFQDFGARKKAAPGPDDCKNFKEKGDPMATELEKEGRITLYGILFDTDSDVLNGTSTTTLDRVAKILASHKEWKVTIEGHTDSAASDDHNQTLSEKRAAAVKKYLVDHGIDAARMKAVGLGEKKPIASNDTSLGRAQNRRVDLVKQ